MSETAKALCYETAVTTRFCETDYMGHISNINYFVYLEDARVDFIVGLGLSRVDETWGFVIASVKCDFVKQMYAGQKLTVTTQVLRIGTKSFSLEHLILSEDGETMARGEETIVRFDRGTQQSLALDDVMIASLKPYLKE
jgi:acyl-CoA thioester hydrolase